MDIGQSVRDRKAGKSNQYLPDRISIFFQLTIFGGKASVVCARCEAHRRAWHCVSSIYY
jgi:hypothetical protein